MGEVYCAIDTKLGREVALKTLPERFAHDTDYLTRFEREAKLLAALNHPNIAAIYGLEEFNGSRFLVLELVDGETLADRLQRGALPVEESLKLALQIAEAVEAAHEKRVTHRDLKPANIKVTAAGRVKVLDFGLAKVFAGESPDASLSDSPTKSLTATQQGVIMGTAAYMSPEQARGETVERQADIWAFGCVLFEMLSGQRTFSGHTVTDVLAGVLAKDPPWQSLPPALHPRVRLLLERCLEKESRNRYRDIADARVDLEKVLSDPQGSLLRTAAQPGRRAMRATALWALTSMLVGSLLTGFAVWNFRPQGPRPIVARFEYVVPGGQEFRSTGQSVVTISPDGRYFLYNSNRGVYLRAVGELEARLVRGTEEQIANPFFSPNGDWIGYWAFGQLKKIPVSGGVAVRVSAAPGDFLGATWTEDDTILFGQPEGIMRVPAGGGTPELLIRIDKSQVAYGPQLLPGGQWVLFTLAQVAGGATRWDTAQIVAQSLYSGERRLLLTGGGDARYVSTGHLVYALQDALFALPFDLRRMAVLGGPVAVVTGVQRAIAPGTNTASANWACSDGGTLVYVQGIAATPKPKRLLVVNARGDATRLTDELRDYQVSRVSPDGSRLAVPITEGSGFHIWILDIKAGTSRQLTFEGTNLNPIWTPDGKDLVFMSNRDGPYALYRQPVDGSAPAKLFLKREQPLTPTDISRDNILAFYETFAGGGGGVGRRNIWTMPLIEGSPAQFGDPMATARDARFSPDGRWIAYASDESGQDEVYVRPYPKAEGGVHRVSSGGRGPVWARDGSKLYYQSLSLRLMAVPIKTSPIFEWGRPRELFAMSGKFQMFGIILSSYDVLPTGERFIFTGVVETTVATTSRRIHIVENWFEEVKARAQVPE
jgi:serine/threonine-protein kinase